MYRIYTIYNIEIWIYAYSIDSINMIVAYKISSKANLRLCMLACKQVKHFSFTKERFMKLSKGLIVLKLG